MFICNVCEEVFEEPKIVYETHGFSCPPYEKWVVCPHCNDTDFQKAKQCDHCGEWVAELHDDMCDVCWDDMYGE